MGPGVSATRAVDVMRGAPLFVLVCALATAPLYDRALGLAAVVALVVIFLTPAIGRRHVQPSAEDGGKPREERSA